MRRFLLLAGVGEVKTGERDRVRARLSREESELEPEPSFSSDIGWGDFRLGDFAADLVVGGKYVSLLGSEASEGVGDGDITLGVSGIGYG